MSSAPQEPGQANNLPTTQSSDNNDTNDNTASSSENEETSEKPKAASRTARLKKTLTCKMFNLCKEVTIMVLVAVAYATLTNNSPPKVSKSPMAYPFFPKESPVTDWYRGEVSKAIEQARASDIAFVMFYAPWDAESQAVRKEFILAARYMHDQVTFAAVNCWQPGSECKSQYSKVFNWPVLIAYPTHGRGVQYNGPLDAAHMVKFLQNVCRPLVLPQNVNDLISRHDTVVLANVYLLPGSYEYAAFYRTSLRFLEKDPFKDIAFAVLPQSPQNQPKLHIYAWNETISYNGEWTSENLLTWISKRLHQIAGWVSPSGTKSLSMSGYIQPGPALILFTPKNPFLEQVDLYSMLKEVAYEYHNCANNNIIMLKQRLIRMERLKNYVSYRDLKNKCLQKSNKRLSNIVMHVPKIWTNATVKTCNDCQACEGHCLNFEETLECNVDPLQHRDRPKTSMLRGLNDPRSAQNLQKKSLDEQCRNFAMAQKFEPPIFARIINESEFSIAGLACKSNRSLALVAMDSLRYYHFAEKLGVDLLNVKDKTGVVIINDKMETHHIMKEALSDLSLRLFIYNFTQGSVDRAVHSNPQFKSKNTHVYPEVKCDSRYNRTCVRELNSENFLPTIMQQNRAAVVFYYSKQCSFCNGIGHTFLTTTKILSSVHNLIFARIDGDLNLLSWEYTMESYPTILFIPAKRKSESRVFPISVPITVPNLLGFILTNLDPVLKLQAMWSICNQSKFEDEKAQCVSSVRAETLSVIDRTLRQWRSAQVRHRAEILHKLQLLRHLHLLFAHSPTEVSLIRHYLNKLESVLGSQRARDEL